MSTIPTTVKEMNTNLVKLLKLQNESKRVQAMGRIIVFEITIKLWHVELHVGGVGLPYLLLLRLKTVVSVPCY